MCETKGQDRAESEQGTQATGARGCQGSWGLDSGLQSPNRLIHNPHYTWQNTGASYRTINVLEKQILSRLVLWKHLILASATWTSIQTNRPSLDFPIKLKISF